MIVEYLDEIFPEPRLVPDDLYERARMRTWMRFIEEVPTSAIRFPSFQNVFVQHFQHLSDEEFAEEAKVRPLRTEFYRKMGRDGFSDEEYQSSLDRLRQTAERVEHAVSGAPWLMGDAYTLADVVVTPVFDRMVDLGMEHIWSDLPSVTDWWERIKERPNFAVAFYLGSRISEREDQLSPIKMEKSND